MDSGVQLTEQAVRCSHVCTANALAIDATTNKQRRILCVISLNGLRVLYRYEKLTKENQNPGLGIILILHVAILIRNLENNKDMTEITNNCYLEEFNLIGSFNTNTEMFSNFSLWKNYKNLKSEGNQF